MTTFFLKNLYFLRYSQLKLVFIVLILLLSLLVVVFVLKGNLKLFLRQWDPKVHSPLDHMSDKEDKPGEKIRKVELLTSHRAVEPSSSELSIRPKQFQHFILIKQIFSHLIRSKSKSDLDNLIKRKFKKTSKFILPT